VWSAYVSRTPHAQQRRVTGVSGDGAVKQAMCASGRGLYCGPLRLLAMEVYDELNAQGTLCDLITGAVLTLPNPTLGGVRRAQLVGHAVQPHHGCGARRCHAW